MRRNILRFGSWIIVLILIVISVYVIEQQRQNKIEIRSEEEMIRKVSRVVNALEGDFIIYNSANGFPYIEYTLETPMAQINLGGLKWAYNIHPDDAMEVLLNEEHTLHTSAWQWLRFGHNYGTPQADYSDLLQELLNENRETLREIFPYEEINWNVTNLSIPILHELIRLSLD